MHARERIIRERFAGQACGHCGTPYPADGILVLARRPAAWMVMASCHECQNRSIFVVSFHDTHDAASGLSIEPSLGKHLFPEAVLPSDPATSSDTSSDSSSDSPLGTPAGAPHTPDRHASSREPVPVTASDVADMREFLAGFQGDFQTLFQRQRQHRGDEGTGD